jgi:hypothetical protein
MRSECREKRILIASAPSSRSVSFNRTERFTGGPLASARRNSHRYVCLSDSRERSMRGRTLGVPVRDKFRAGLTNRA